MAFVYPDVMNDITDARQRFESGAVQYLAEFPSAPTSAGGSAPLQLTLQNVMSVPVQVAIRIELPKPKGKLKRVPQPPFQIFQPDIRLALEGGEVGQLTIPVQIDPGVPPGEYTLDVHVRSEATQEAVRARPERTENRLGEIKIRYPQGLAMTMLVSWGFEARKRQEQTVSLAVSEPREEPTNGDLKPQFRSLWTPQDWDLIARARQEVNDQRVRIVSELVTETLYVAFMQESQSLLTNSGVQLHIGEAIFWAKMLTYTVTYLLRNAEWQDCLLVPIYAYAIANDQPMDDTVWLVTQLGYTHVLELAIALSFGLVEEQLQRTLWERTEQLALREYIVQSLESQNVLPNEFLYLPLLLGGITVSREITFSGEDVQESLRLLARAKGEKASAFADPELQNLNQAFDRLVARRARS